jgi:23S rRNA (uracil1939-C5)-methyltransferase
MKLQVEKMVYGGAGIAHDDTLGAAARTLLVPFTLPGELVEVELTELKDTVGEAKDLKVLTSSQERIRPSCHHFGECGGCSYQHARYPAQIEIKTSILQETLQYVGIAYLPEIKTYTGEQWHYRNRARLRIEDLEGAFRVGYNQRGSNHFLAISECPILSPILWHAAERLLTITTEKSPAGRWIRSASEVEFFTSADEKKLQMALFVQKNQPGFPEFCERMKQLTPELAGAGSSLIAPKRPQRQMQKPRPLASWGSNGLSYEVAGEGYWVSRGGFFQVNRYLIDELVKIVTAQRRGRLAWDLYAGVGLFSRQLTKGFMQVVAVEAAGTDLANSFRGQGRTAVEATTFEFLRNAVVQRERPELIVMDPPRAGVGAEVCSLLARIAAPEIVYVSCDPVTLARDLTMLVEAGYNLVELHLVDLFPQTFHLETVAVLRR